MAPSPPKPAATILVVDDDREVLSLAVDLLRSAGYTVVGTADPSQALQLARDHAKLLDLLLTDVVMPLKSGLRLASEVRAIRPEVKILLISLEFQRNGNVKPAISERVQEKAKTILATTNLFSAVSISSDGSVDRLDLVVNNIADTGDTIGKGIKTGLTFGGVGSRVTDSYVLTAPAGSGRPRRFQRCEAAIRPRGCHSPSGW